MQILLKRRMAVISSALLAAGKLRLAHCIDQNWHKTCLSYSKELNFWRPKRAMEPALVHAFDKELMRLGFIDLFKKDILASLQRRRGRQTPPHPGNTEG